MEVGSLYLPQVRDCGRGSRGDGSMMPPRCRRTNSLWISDPSAITHSALRAVKGNTLHSPGQGSRSCNIETAQAHMQVYVNVSTAHHLTQGGPQALKLSSPQSLKPSSRPKVSYPISSVHQCYGTGIYRAKRGEASSPKAAVGIFVPRHHLGLRINHGVNSARF